MLFRSSLDEVNNTELTSEELDDIYMAPETYNQSDDVGQPNALHLLMPHGFIPPTQNTNEEGH